MVRIAGSLGALMLACGVVAAQTSTPKPSSTAPVAIQHWSGTLMDANCAGGEQSTSESGAKTESAGVDKGRPEKGHKKNPEAQSCTVSSSTTAFALKAKSGQVIKFDVVGNARAAEDLKSKWTKELSAGKPIHAKVSGTLNGDTVTVTAIG
jgi:hypothetical protein